MNTLKSRVLGLILFELALGNQASATGLSGRIEGPCHRGLAAATIPKPTVAQYAGYFSNLEVGIFANSFAPYEVC